MASELIKNEQLYFRQWATSVLKDFSIRGYVIDKERLKNGTFLNEEYFDHLIEEIREIRPEDNIIMENNKPKWSGKCTD